MWDGKVDSAWLARAREWGEFPSTEFIKEHNDRLVQMREQGAAERERLDREAMEGAAS